MRAQGKVREGNLLWENGKIQNCFSSIKMWVFEDSQPHGTHKVVLTGTNYIDKQQYKK